MHASTKDQQGATGATGAVHTNLSSLLRTGRGGLGHIVNLSAYWLIYILQGTGKFLLKSVKQFPKRPTCSVFYMMIAHTCLHFVERPS